MEKLKLSLKEKAIIGIIAIVIPILVTFVLVYCKNRVYLKNRVLDTLSVIAESYEGQVYQFLEKGKIRAQDFASDGFIRTYLQKAIQGNASAINKLNKHLVKNKLSLDKTINAINILSMDGRVVASTKRSEMGKDLSTDVCFEEGRHALTILEHRSGYEGLYEITISTPVFTKETGKPIGVIVNYILASELNKLLLGEYIRDLGAISWGKGKGAWKTLEVYLVNRDKLMITKSIFVKDAVLKQQVGTTPVIQGLTLGKEMAGFYPDYRGIEVVGASMYIPSMKWVLLVEIDKDEVLAPIRHVLTSALITAAVVIILITALLIGFLEKMVKPLRKISEASKKIAGGNFDVTIPVQTQDDIGALCASFNYMAGHIKARTTALAKSEARLAEAQRIASIGNWEWDAAKNEICFSYEAHRIFGLKTENLVASVGQFMDCVHPEDREFVRKSFDEALRSRKSLGIDHRIVLKDATVRIVHEKAEVISGNGGTVVQIVGTVQDITDRKRAEEHLRASEEKLRAILDNAPAVVYMKDVQGRYTFINSHFERLFHVNRNDIRGKSDHDLWAKETADAFRANDIKVTEVKSPLEFDEIAPHDDGPHNYISVKFPLFDQNGRVSAVCGISTDITERKKMEEAKVQLSEIIDAAADLVASAEIDGRVTYLNRAGRKLLGMGENEDITKTYIREYHPQWASELVLNEGIPDAIREGHWVGETSYLCRDGREIPFSQIIIAHKNPDGTIKYLSTIARDITERKRYETQIVHMASRDPLTNLLNRRRFHEELESWLAQARRFGIHGALVFLDLDNFKYINDSLGHQTGDRLLMMVANILRERLRETDILARLGGDEFAIILPHADVELAESVANQIRELVQYRTAAEREYLSGVTVSIGIAMFPGHGNTVETLLSYADLAMYRAKEDGRNRACIYSPEQKTQVELRLTWEKRIREALSRDSFVLYLQPILDLRNNIVSGHEALLRMINEKGETDTPSNFLNVAERFGLIHDIDRWVVSKAIHLIKKLQQEGQVVSLEVNLSGKSFADKELLPLIRSELAATGIDPIMLIFEITETALIENIAVAQHFITELKSLGCRFALDDFGIGFSSFDYVKHLPVDYLKIDGSFIRNLPHDVVDQHLVKAMVEVARGLGKKTVAEFVQDEETLSLLREYGVDYAQGYHVGKPRHMSELVAI